MMKIKFITISFSAILLLLACESKNNLAYQRKVEKEKIAKYFKANSIQIIELAKDEQNEVYLNATPPNVFYHLGDDSIYFRLDEVGVGDTAKSGDIIEVRYVRQTLDIPPIEESYWTTEDLLYPIEVVYGDRTYTEQNCGGWQSAIRVMKCSEALAQIIVPSSIGMYSDYNSVTPYHYKFWFKILPK